MFIAAFHRRASNGDAIKTEVQWLGTKCHQLLGEMHATRGEKDRVFRFVNAVSEMDKASDGPARMARWKDIWKAIEAETTANTERVP